MKFISSDSAVSEVVGHAIILAITIVGVSMIVLVGVPSILKLEEVAKIKNAEQTSTVLDSLASSTILGDSPQQIVNMNLDGGVLSIKPNNTDTKSYIEIRSKNNTFNLMLPLGKIEYRLGERTVGYEGGGIWSKYPTGSVMLSPPEFHYNGRTLTLPVITLTGNGNIGGNGAAAISLKKNSSMILFPNPSIQANRTNPLDYIITGKVYVNITSDYYDAWAEYARNLIFTEVTTNSTNHLASIELTVVPSGLGYPTPINQPVNLRGIPDNETPLDNFSFKLYMPHNANEFDIRALNGNKQLIYFLDFNHKELTIGYQEDTEVYGETWGPYEYVTGTDSLGEYIDLNLLNESAYLLYHDVPDVGTTNGINDCKPNGKKINGLAVPDYSWDNIVLDGTGVSNPNNTQSLYNITQHYIWKMSQSGDTSFYQCAPATNKKFPLGDSTVTIDYAPIGGITFLHIQNNTADVSIT